MRSICVRVALIAAIIALWQLLGLSNFAHADEAAVRAQCAAIGKGPNQVPASTSQGTIVSTYSPTRARTLGLRPVALGTHIRPHVYPRFSTHRGGGGIAGLIVGVAIAVAVSAISEDNARQEAEKNCLISHGLIKPSKPKAPPSRVDGDGIRRGISVAPTSHCACPQMKTCNGSWATRTCKQLIETCQNPRSPLQYTINSCDKLKQLVGF